VGFSADPRRWDPDPDERAARVTVRLLAAGLLVAVLGAVVAFTVYNLRSDGDDATPGGGTAAVGAENAIGPPPGADLGSYQEAARAALAGAQGERLAVVSLKSYRTEADARRVVGDLPVVSLLVAMPGRAPTATGDLARWVEDQKKEERAERDEIRRLIPTVEDPAFKRFYTEEVARLDKAIASVPRELVFAVVVRGAPARLQSLAASPDVRMVDVARGDLGPDSEYRGVRPEETAVAGNPSTRPL